MKNRLKTLFPSLIICLVSFLVTSCSMNQEQGLSLSSVSEESLPEINYTYFQDIISLHSNLPNDFEGSNCIHVFIGIEYNEYDDNAMIFEEEYATDIINQFAAVPLEYEYELNNSPTELIKSTVDAITVFSFYQSKNKLESNTILLAGVWICKDGTLRVQNTENNHNYYSNSGCVDYDKFHNLVFDKAHETGIRIKH